MNVEVWTRIDATSSCFGVSLITLDDSESARSVKGAEKHTEVPRASRSRFMFRSCCVSIA